MNLYDSFAAAFDAPSVSFLKGDTEVTKKDGTISKLQALIDHPATPEGERQAAQSKLDRLES